MLSALQENLLVILCWDPDRAAIIRNTVGIAHWGGPYRVMAQRIYDYIDRFKKPPKDHLPDILEDKINSGGRESTLYTDIIENLYAAKDGVNAEYAMAQLETFIRRQSMRTIAIDLSKALQRDTEESLEEAERLIAGAGRVSISVFDPGTRLSDVKRTLKFLDIHETAFPTGIPDLDKRGFGPTRKELWLYVSDTKRGKSWMLIQLAKMALMHRIKVAHVTLELSEARCSQRYMQALFALAKRKEPVQLTKFKKDNLGNIIGFDDQRIIPKLTLDDPKIRGKLEKRIKRWSSRMLDNIFIKEFPTGALTVNQLTAYLDNLENAQGFIPDLLIIDYPDLMKIDKANPRMSIDEIYKDVRGIAGSRNLAVAVVSQSHRAAAKSKQVGSENVAEAYSKIAHSDTTITYSQSKHEKKLGLARLFVAAGRNDEDKFTLVISQNYATGQYVVDSAMQKGNYFGLLPKEEDDE